MLQYLHWWLVGQPLQDIELGADFRTRGWRHDVLRKLKQEKQPQPTLAVHLHAASKLAMEAAQGFAGFEVVLRDGLRRGIEDAGVFAAEPDRGMLRT